MDYPVLFGIFVMGSVFGIIKLLFSLIGFLTTIPGEGKLTTDEKSKKALEDMWFILHEKTIFQIFHSVLKKLFTKIMCYSSSFWRSLGWFVIIMIFLNMSSCAVGISFSDDNTIQEAFEGLFNIIYKPELPVYILGFLLAIPLTIFDLVSLFLTLYLIHLAIQTERPLVLFGHVVLDVFVCAISILFVSVIAVPAIVFCYLDNVDSGFSCQ